MTTNNKFTFPFAWGGASKWEGFEVEYQPSAYVINDWKETMLTGIGSTANDTTSVERDFVSILDRMIQHGAH